MKFNNDLLSILNKKHDRDAIVNISYKNYDLTMKTDREGNAILLFMGKISDSGMIKGERYARRLKYRPDGSVLKDHWELKGKAS